MFFWPVQVSCPGHAPSQISVQLLTSRARDTEKSLNQVTPYFATANHPCDINIIFILNPKHRTEPDTKKKMNSPQDDIRLQSQKL